MSLSAGIPIENIAKMKGHVSILSTQTYAQVTDCKISAKAVAIAAVRTIGENDW